MEDVNLLLNTGDIPNIFENEERLEIIDKMQRETQAEGNNQTEINPLNMYSKFIERVNRQVTLTMQMKNGERMISKLNYCCTVVKVYYDERQRLLRWFGIWSFASHLRVHMFSDAFI